MFAVTPWTLTCRSRWPGRDDAVVPVDDGDTVYDALRAGGRPLAGACTGDAVCGRCVVRVLEGVDRLTTMDSEERAVLTRCEAAPDERLACRVRPIGAGIVLSTGYW